MKLVTWRTAALVLAVVCCYQRWQSCTRTAPRSTVTEVECPTVESPSAAPGRPAAIAAPAEPAIEPRTRSFYGVRLPGWLNRLTPQPGESLRDYRDRMLPVAQLAVAPQRARVARLREAAGLERAQLAELDGAVEEAAAAIERRVRTAIAAGPASMRPMAGVTMARELLELVERGDARFQRSLTPEQRTALASQRFDFADYLLFSARWEDALRRAN